MTRAASLATVTAIAAFRLAAQCPSGTPTITATAPASASSVGCLQTSGTVTVSGGAGVTFQAATAIYLMPGFTAQAGSSGTAFTALIAPVSTDYTITSSVPSLALPVGQSSAPVTFTVTPANGFTGSVTLSVVSAPTGVTVTPSTATLNLTGPATFTATVGAGANAQAGTVVIGGSGAAANAAIAVMVQPALTITTSYLPAGVTGLPYSATLTALAGSGTLTWSVTGSVPGLTIASSGLVSGTPSAAGTYSLTATVSESGSPSQTASAQIPLVIAQPLAVPAASLPGGNANVAYSTALTATGGTYPYSWSIAAGSALPAGLALSSTGTITGTPTAAGVTTFTAAVSDSASPAQTTSRNFTITIGPAPSILTSAIGVYAVIPANNTATLVSQNLALLNGSGLIVVTAPTITPTSGGPAGLQVNPPASCTAWPCSLSPVGQLATLALSVTAPPSAAGYSYQITLQAYVASGAAPATVSFLIEVASAANVQLSASPAAAVVSSTSPASFTVTAAPEPGFSNNTAPTLFSAPAHLNCPAPSGLSASGTFVLTCTDDGSLAAGTYVVDAGVETYGASPGEISSIPLFLTVGTAGSSPAAPSDWSLVSKSGSLTVPQGGTTQAYVALEAYNGYTGVPTLTAQSLPTGVTVAFSNGGQETYGVVTATISVTPQASAGLSSITIVGSDGFSTYTLNLPFTITAPPLSVTTSLMFSNASAATLTAQLATVYAATTGGAAPFTFAWTSGGALLSQNQNPALSIAAPASAMPISLTVTDSSSPAQTATLALIIPAAPTLSQALLEAAVLEHAAALNDFAAHIANEGADNQYISTLLQTQTGLTSAQASAVSTQATNYRNDRKSLNAWYSALTTGLHSQGLSAQSAGGSAKTSLQTIYTNETTLPATYHTNLLNALGSAALSQLDNWAASGLAPKIQWCIADCGQNSTVDLTVFTDITANQGTGEIVGYASAQLSGFDSDANVTDSNVYFNVLNMTGAGEFQPSAGQFEVDAEFYAAATQSGIYSITASAGASVDFGDGTPPWNGYGTSTSSVSYSGPTCTGPVINSVEIYPSGSTAPQPTAGLLAGSSGTIQVDASCLDDSAQLSFDGAGITLNTATLANGGGSIQAPYSIDANEPAESRSLILTTSAGSTTIPVQIVTSTPYIQSISPSNWPSGQTTNVTIAGAGFGSNPGTGSTPVSFGSQYAMNWSLQSWADGQITGTVSPASNDPGETVTVSVTGGSYGIGFLSNPGSGVPSPTATAEVVGGTQCLHVQIYEQTTSPNTLPVRNPATIRTGFAPVFQVTTNPQYCGVQWTVTGPGAIVGTPNSNLVTVVGTSAGTAYIQATGTGGLSSTTTVPVKQQLNIPIYGVIVRDSSGNNAAVTPQYMLDDLNQANLVWQQAGVQFTLVGSAYVDSTSLLNTDSLAARQTLTTTTTP